PGRAADGASRLRRRNGGRRLRARGRVRTDPGGGRGRAGAVISVPDFRSRAFLVDHIRETLAFYHPRCIDPRGGFFHLFRDHRTVYDAHTRSEERRVGKGGETTLC